MTAVEKLEIRLLGIISFDSEELRAKYKEAIKQAKEMEKQQRDYSEEEPKKNCKHNWIRDNDSFNLKPYCKKCGIDY